MVAVTNELERLKVLAVSTVEKLDAVIDLFSQATGESPSVLLRYSSPNS